jgi:hypothetical protein
LGQHGTSGLELIGRYELLVIDLSALVYVSKASRPLTEVDLSHLLDRARTRNAQEEVTGVLLYSHGNFIQYLEGSHSAIERVYTVIKADPQHHGIIELMREPIQSREFSHWSMAFRNIRAFGLASPPEIDEIFEAAGSAGIRPASVAQVFLSKFWNKGSLSG